MTVGPGGGASGWVGPTNTWIFPLPWTLPIPGGGSGGGGTSTSGIIPLISREVAPGGALIPLSGAADYPVENEENDDRILILV